MPFVQRWLVQHGHQEQDPGALAQILCTSLADYIECYKKYPFFHRHETHLFPALRASLDGNYAELHLTAHRDKRGVWFIGSPSCFIVTDQYHADRLTQEMQAAVANT